MSRNAFFSSRSEKNNFFDVDIVAKNKSYVVNRCQCTLIDDDMRLHSGENKEMVSVQRSACSLQRTACNYQVMDAREWLLSTKEALEWHEAITECDSHYSIVAHCTFTISFIILRFLG